MVARRAARISGAAPASAAVRSERLRRRGGGRSTTTRCGSATSAVGPFYCPADQGIYLDLGFFEVLRTQYGAGGGDFAQAYVIAHEYGHHIQNLTGQSAQVRRGETGPQSGAVRLEQQADCYAGVWAGNAQRDGFVTFDDEDIHEGCRQPPPWATTASSAAVHESREEERHSTPTGCTGALPGA